MRIQQLGPSVLKLLNHVGFSPLDQKNNVENLKGLSKHQPPQNNQCDHLLKYQIDQVIHLLKICPWIPTAFRIQSKQTGLTFSSQPLVQLHLPPFQHSNQPPGTMLTADSLLNHPREVSRHTETQQSCLKATLKYQHTYVGLATIYMLGTVLDPADTLRNRSQLLSSKS